MNWKQIDKKKVLKWGVNACMLAFIIVYFDGGARTWGLIGFVMGNLIIAGWRMYQSRDSIKVLFAMAGTMGAAHKERAQQRKEARKNESRKRRN